MERGWEKFPKRAEATNIEKAALPTATVIRWPKISWIELLITEYKPLCHNPSSR